MQTDFPSLSGIQYDMPISPPPTPSPAPVKKKRKYTKRKTKQVKKVKKVILPEPVEEEKEMNHRNYIFKETFDKKMKYLKRRIMEARDPKSKQMYKDHIEKLQGKEIIF